MRSVLIGLVILFTLVAAWYLYLGLTPSQRSLRRFVYCTGTAPDALNGAFPVTVYRRLTRKRLGGSIRESFRVIE